MQEPLPAMQQDFYSPMVQCIFINRAGGSIPNATWSANSTCKVTGLTNGDAGNDQQAFGNLVYDCPNMTGNRILGGNGLSIAGNLEIVNTGAANLVQGLSTLTVGGNFILREVFSE